MPPLYFYNLPLALLTPVADRGDENDIFLDTVQAGSFSRHTIPTMRFPSSGVEKI